MSASSNRPEVLRATFMMSLLVALALGLPSSAVPGEENPAPDRAGWRRVIAELRIEEEACKVPARADCARAIAAAQEALLAELGDHPHRITARFRSLPFLGLDVSPTALRVLKASALVKKIEEDAVNAPLPGR